MSSESSESSSLQLQLAQPPDGLAKTKGARLGIPIMIILQLAILVMIAWRWFAGGATPAPTANAVDPSDHQELALALEQRSLNGPAAVAWEAYLKASAEVDQHAVITFRIGKLYVEGRQPEKAVRWLVQADLLAQEEGDKALRRKVGTQLVAALRMLGKYGEVSRELSRQVEVGVESKQPVVATIDGEVITSSDLDRRIERSVDRMLATSGNATPALRRQLVQQMSSPAQRQQVLQQLVQSELLSRRARELKLDQDDEFRDALESFERNYLAGRLQQQELEKIQVTDVDLKSYFAAHQKDYDTPVSLTIHAIQLKADEDAADLLKRLDSWEKLIAEARERAKNENRQTLVDKTILQGRPDSILGDVSQLFKLTDRSWTKSPIDHQGKRYFVLVEKKTEAKPAKFEEVRAQIAARYRQLKQREVGENLWQDLMKRYQVEFNEENLKKSSANSKKLQQGEGNDP